MNQVLFNSYANKMIKQNKRGENSASKPARPIQQQLSHTKDEKTTSVMSYRKQY